MNMKTMGALAAVVVMLCASTVAAVAYAGDVDAVGPNTTITVGQHDTNGDAVLVWFSESEYVTSDITGFTVKWYATADTTSFITSYNDDWVPIGSRTVTNTNSTVGDLSGNNAAAVDNDSNENLLNVHLTSRSSEDSTLDNYTLNVKNYISDDNTANKNGTVYLTICTSVSLDVGAGERQEVNIDPKYQYIQVNVVSDTMTVTAPTGIVEHSKVNAEISAKINDLDGSASGSEVLLSNYSWYAKKLPTGLSMSSKGMIVGYPLAATAGDGVDVQVFAVHNGTGLTYSGTMKLIVGAVDDDKKTPSITLSIDGTDGTDFIKKTATGANDSYYLEQDANGRTLTVESTHCEVTYVVSMDKATGQYTVLTNNNGYTIDVSGVGSYLITAYGIGPTGERAQTTIQLYVFSNADGEVSAEIIVNSEP